MATRKIGDLDNDGWFPNNGCQNPEHDPPSMMVFEPGVYEHECPGCGNKRIFVAPPKPSL